MQLAGHQVELTCRSSRTSARQGQACGSGGCTIDVHPLLGRQARGLGACPRGVACSERTCSRLGPADDSPTPSSIGVVRCRGGGRRRHPARDPRVCLFRIPRPSSRAEPRPSYLSGREPRRRTCASRKCEQADSIAVSRMMRNPWIYGARTRISAHAAYQHASDALFAAG